MNIGSATEYRNTSQLYSYVNLLTIAGAVEYSNGGASGGWRGGIPSSVEVGSGAPEKIFDFIIRNV